MAVIATNGKGVRNIPDTFWLSLPNTYTSSEFL